MLQAEARAENYIHQTAQLSTTRQQFPRSVKAYHMLVFDLETYTYSGNLNKTKKEYIQAYV